MLQSREHSQSGSCILLMEGLGGRWKIEGFDITWGIVQDLLQLVVLGAFGQSSLLVLGLVGSAVLGHMRFDHVEGLS
jgi:hypothetical protein